MRRQWIFNRARNRAQRRLVQHDVDAATRVAARSGIDDVGFDESMPAPRGVTDRGFHFVQIHAMPGRKIIEPDDILLELQQRLDEMRADKTRAARDESRERTGAQCIDGDFECRRSRTD